MYLDKAKHSKKTYAHKYQRKPKMKIDSWKQLFFFFT